ncbi:MAG: hypothetical protein M0023_13275 [Desulfobacteraceae bacterium]|nr:hypothetical protein [Desulfobacteraceae bacterium]
MQFNRFVWTLYCNSDEGRAAIERKVSDHLKAVPVIRESAAFMHQMFYYEVSNGDFVENGTRGFKEVNLRDLIEEHAADIAIADIDDAEKLFTEIADEGAAWPFEDQGKNFELFFGGGEIDTDCYGGIFSSIDGLSAGLHDAHPEFFVPYLFARRFDEFEKICHSFDIPLSQVPGKLQKRERALYYLSINRALYEFRKKHELSPQELNAFLYDFAPKNLGCRPESDLPPPSRIWFVIGGVGGNGDFEYLDSANGKSVSYWQGSLETRRGDIILMWCASPRSYLHSVWRALDDGFNDPFFYFYSLIRVGHPTKISPIPFSEFSKHPILGSKPAVRAHFQGASGTPFSIEDYAAIRELLQNNRFDISELPLPPTAGSFLNTELQNERDVELTLVEPLLKRLGFTEKDWIRQFPLRMGRGERNFPDYVLGGVLCPGDESAEVLIECKFDIETKKDLKDAFVQAKSYALRLQALSLALAARRGFWVFRRRDDGFSIDHFMFKTWNELTHPDALHEISVVLGKCTIEASINKRSIKKQASKSV